jgi:hypothetical protein
MSGTRLSVSAWILRIAASLPRRQPRCSCWHLRREAALVSTNSRCRRPRHWSICFFGMSTRTKYREVKSYSAVVDDFQSANDAETEEKWEYASNWTCNIGFMPQVSFSAALSLCWTLSVNVLMFLRRLNSMKSSRAIHYARCLYSTDVSRTISVIIIPHDDDDDDRWFSKRRFSTDTWRGWQPEKISTNCQ